MTHEVFATEADLAKALAERVAARIRRQPALVLGLPTGRTPLCLYGELVRITRGDQLDWARVRTFNLDEFVGLPAEAPGSYRAFMKERLFRHVNVTGGNVGFPRGEAADLDAECQRYEDAIQQAGGIDLMLLGIGANGHIGFNEPGEQLLARTHRAILEERSRADNALWFGGDMRRVPHEALSMGMATILNARDIVLMATGEGKADVVREMIEGPVTTRLPASFLQLHPRVEILLDAPAAGEDGARPE